MRGPAAGGSEREEDVVMDCLALCQTAMKLLGMEDPRADTVGCYKYWRMVRAGPLIQPTIDWRLKALQYMIGFTCTIDTYDTLLLYFDA